MSTPALSIHQEPSLCQKGAVVTRALLQNETGTLTIFNHREGQALTHHTVLPIALVNILDGHADITTGGKAVLLGAGENVFISDRIPRNILYTQQLDSGCCRPRSKPEQTEGFRGQRRETRFVLFI